MHILFLIIGIIIISTLQFLLVEILQLLEILPLNENLLQCGRILARAKPTTAIAKFVFRILDPFLTLLGHLQDLKDSNFAIFALVHQLEATLPLAPRTKKTMI